MDQEMTKIEQFEFLEKITIKAIKGRAEMMKQKVINGVLSGCAASFDIEKLCKSEAYNGFLISYETRRSCEEYENKPFDAYLDAMEWQEHILFNQADGEYSTSAASRCNAHYQREVARELMRDPLYNTAKEASKEYHEAHKE